MGVSIDAATILGWVIFGGIAMIALGWAKLKDDWRPAVLGVALGGFPYFVPSGWLFWVLGVGLTSALFVWKE